MEQALIYKTEPTDTPIYHSWLKFANERDILEEALRKRFEEWCYTKPLSMLEWGCGLGSAAQRFMRILRERSTPFTYIGIDPFPDQLDRFRKALSDEVDAQFEIGGFETYIPNRAYDLGLAVHSLYYAKSIPTTVEKISQSARRMFFVHHGIGGINEVHERFPELVIQEASEISTHEIICETLRGLYIPYDLHIYETEIKIEVCHDPKNLDGRNMIKFFLDNPNLPEEKIEEVSRFLQGLGNVMKHDMAVIITSPK